MIEATVNLDGVGKTFGATTALKDITLQMSPGRMHALVGQNGAGKSTCMGLIAGRIAATSGLITVGGTSYPSNISPLVAQRMGTFAVYQELSIVPAMSAVANAFLGNEFGRWGRIDSRTMLRGFGEMSERLGIAIDPNARAGTLSIADQQMLEIMRGLLQDARVLLLDEPTAALAPHERTSLFRALHDLLDQGVTVGLVSHYLDEVVAHSDDISVFRDGRLVETREVSNWTEQSLVRQMLGEEFSLLDTSATGVGEPIRPIPSPHPDQSAPPRLRVEGLTVGNVDDLSFHVAAGEVVGLGGLVGSGRSTVLRALSGLQRVNSGRLWLDGEEVPFPRSPRAAWDARISLVPEDRKASGLVMGRSGRDNIVLGDLRRAGQHGIVSTSIVRVRTRQLADRYGISGDLLDRPAGALSGGNQQKLLFARWGFRVPLVLLADEATRGIDIGAKAQILRSLRELAGQGLAVIFISSELEEVAAVSDRVYVLRAGRLTAELHAADGPISQDDILTPAFGLRDNDAS